MYTGPSVTSEEALQPLELAGTKLHHRTICLIASFRYNALCRNGVVKVTKEMYPKGTFKILHHGSATLHVGFTTLWRGS